MKGNGGHSFWFVRFLLNTYNMMLTLKNDTCGGRHSFWFVRFLLNTYNMMLTLKNDTCGGSATRRWATGNYPSEIFKNMFICSVRQQLRSFRPPQLPLRNFQKHVYLLGTTTIAIILPPPKKYISYLRLWCLVKFLWESFFPKILCDITYSSCFIKERKSRCENEWRKTSIPIYPCLPSFFFSTIFSEILRWPNQLTWPSDVQ